MKSTKFNTFILCCLLFVGSISYSQDTSKYEGIKWTEGRSWEDIRSMAKSTNKYIFIDCYATWCVPCKMMDRDVYPHFRTGYAMNEHFISIKVQMDSSSKDDDHTRRWYADAKKIMREYEVDAFPTYLFFSPDGHLVHHESGFKDLISFTRMSELARDPQKKIFYDQYESYKKGRKTVTTLGDLAIFTKKLIGDKAVAFAMAKEYKLKYLDKLTIREIVKPHLDFIGEFPELVKSGDKFFRLAYNDPKKFDSLKGDLMGLATWLVNQTIIREEIENKIINGNKPYIKSPAWGKIQSTISRKYKLVNAEKLLLGYQVKYYRDYYKDWKLWAKYKDEILSKYPPQPPYDLEVYSEINGHGGAWHAFLYCNDESVLQTALRWSDLALKLDGNELAYKKAAYLDTKANILYKLGKKEEALELEKQAVDLAENNNPEILEAYKKMLLGQPTWIVN